MIPKEEGEDQVCVLHFRRAPATGFLAIAENAQIGGMRDWQHPQVVTVRGNL